jgi:hypothetical protein
MSKTVACACRSFEFGDYDPDTEDDNTYTTGCSQTTTRVFAQGHDAKLVGFLVRAQLNGDEIAQIDGGMRTTYMDAVHAARTFSEELAIKAQAQLDAAKARLAKTAAREAAKTARASAKKAAAVAPEPATRTATIKRGRWTYEATIDTKTQWATYTNKKGELISVASTDYTEV